jgi:hypothetical protein
VQPIWKKIEGLCGRYEYEVSNAGEVRNATRQKALKPSEDKYGYLVVSLPKDGAYRHAFVHRLVAAAFCGGGFEGATVNHKDSDKLNNRADNLEWVSHVENSHHYQRTLNPEWTPETWKTKRRARKERPGGPRRRGRKIKPVAGTNLATGAVVVVNGHEEAQLLGFHPSGISSAARGRLKKYKGHSWRFLTDKDS